MKKNKPCFVIAPIGEANSTIRKRSDSVYKHIIEPVLKENGYKAIRADQIKHPGMIGTQVIKYIIENDLVLADLTGHNPNVFYELAIRHTLGKPVIQIIDIDSALPFDISHSRTIKFDYRDLDSVEECKKQIRDQIHSIAENPDDIDNPVRSVLDTISVRGSENPTEKLTGQIFERISELNDKFSDMNAAMFGKNGVYDVRAILTGSSVQATYIDGEKEAFEALTNVTKQSKEVIRSTRFFPGSVISSQPEYVHAMEQRVTGTDGNPKLRHYTRIVAINHEKKRRDINHHLSRFYGYPFELYLTNNENAFELVIVDESDVFIHFYKEEKVISATLHIKSRQVVKEFIDIFNILKNTNLIEKFDLEKYDEDTILEAQTKVNSIFKEKFSQNR